MNFDEPTASRPSRPSADPGLGTPVWGGQHSLVHGATHTSPRNPAVIAAETHVLGANHASLTGKQLRRNMDRISVSENTRIRSALLRPFTQVDHPQHGICNGEMVPDCALSLASPPTHSYRYIPSTIRRVLGGSARDTRILPLLYCILRHGVFHASIISSSYYYDDYPVQATTNPGASRPQLHCSINIMYYPFGYFFLLFI